jgi:hypothetical protein
MESAHAVTALGGRYGITKWSVEKGVSALGHFGLPVSKL